MSDRVARMLVVTFWIDQVGGVKDQLRRCGIGAVRQHQQHSSGTSTQQLREGVSAERHASRAVRVYTHVLNFVPACMVLEYGTSTRHACMHMHACKRAAW